MFLGRFTGPRSAEWARTTARGAIGGLNEEDEVPTVRCGVPTRLLAPLSPLNDIYRAMEACRPDAAVLALLWSTVTVEIERNWRNRLLDAPAACAPAPAFVHADCR